MIVEQKTQFVSPDPKSLALSAKYDLPVGTRAYDKTSIECSACANKVMVF